MKKIKRALLIMTAVFAILLVSGCTVDYQKGDDGKPIVDENGVKIVTNPITPDDTFKSVWEEDGWFSAIIVFPLVRLITFVAEITSSYGLAIIISTFLVRFAVLPLTIKGTKQQKMMRELTPQIDKIKLKYADKKDRESQIRMNAEVQKLYKDNNINIFGGLIGVMVSLPIFLGFYAAIYRTPGVFEDPFLGFQLNIIPKVGVLTFNEYKYIIPVIIIFVLNFISMKYTQAANSSNVKDVKRPYNANKEKNPNMMEQQMKIMTYFMPVLMAIISFSLPVGVGLYFISSSLVSIVQAFIVKRYK